ncbi:MAG TPA: tripartite tricarboxylate transporter substrate binding protein [Crenalkalicoccus sp.]|jgi:tripartite-type tricarboxylate transporter receptor subunit TctC|nr:tripartite tricarboxylate transporter substrate binding protein [Crenalkalicoccus sp.]
MGSSTGAPTRRAVLALALAAPQVAGAAAEGADWPSQPVRYINPYPAGGPTDTLSRIWCARMGEIAGQPFVVENRGGSGGNVGADAIAKARPDGYTIGLGGIASHAIAPALYPSLPFDPARDFTHVSGLWQLPNMLVVNLELPVRSVPELIALLKANPGRYSYGSAGPGTTIHLAGAMFAQMAGVEIVHVPYRGTGPAMLDLLAGRIHMIFDNIPGGIAQARQGKARGLATTGAQRSPVAPDLPTMGEILPGFEMVSWTTVCGPAGLPAAMVGRLSAMARQALESPQLRAAYLDLGATPWWTTPEDAAAWRAAQEAKLRPLVLASGARPD